MARCVKENKQNAEIGGRQYRGNEKIIFAGDRWDSYKSKDEREKIKDTKQN